MLGPSGSGKTTCLRLISGFETPTAGHVRIFGEPAEHLPPNRRAVNTVFQDYALFPAPRRPRQRRLRPDGAGRAPRPSATGRPRRCSRSSGSTASATAGRRSSRAASASASRSPGRWSTARGCCSSTSRSGRSTSSSARRCRTSSRRCRRGSASPSSSSPTTRARRCRWPTGWRSSTPAAWRRSGRRRRSTSARGRASSPTSSARPTCCRRTSPPASGRAAGRACGRRRSAWPGRGRPCEGTVRATRYLGAGTRVAVDLGGAEVSLLAPPGPAPEPGARVGPGVGRGALNRAGGRGVRGVPFRARLSTEAGFARESRPDKRNAPVARFAGPFAGARDARRRRGVQPGPSAAIRVRPPRRTRLSRPPPAGAAAAGFCRRSKSGGLQRFRERSGGRPADTLEALAAGAVPAMNALSDLFWRRPAVLLALLLAPPLLWLGVVYLGALAALLAQSFFAIDPFSGLVVREFTLATYAELFRPANLDIIVRTVAMAALVTLASIAIAFPIAYFAARHARGRWKALFYLAIMLPLWSSYLVKIYAWKMILAKEGIVSWAAGGPPPRLAPRRPPRPAGDRRAVAVGQLSRHLPRLRLRLAAVHDPADAGGARARAGRACSRPRPTSAPRRARPSAT